MLTLYTADTGNGRKPTLLLKLLNVEHKLHLFQWPTTDIKQDWYLKLNPNGTIPTLVDDANDIVLFESNAILQYIIDHYDEGGQLSYSKVSNSKYYYLQQQWLYYQACSFTNATTIAKINHTLKNDSILIVQKSINAWSDIYNLLEQTLENSASGWFVGDKFTIADLVLAVGNHRRIEKTTGSIFEINDFEQQFPAVSKWYKKVLKIEGVDSILK